MCRSIVRLRSESPATDDEVRAAALQFVRKVSGYRQPSKANAAAFDTAVDEITASVERLLAQLPAIGALPQELVRQRSRPAAGRSL